MENVQINITMEKVCNSYIVQLWMAGYIDTEILYFFFVCFAVDTNSNLLTDLY